MLRDITLGQYYQTESLIHKMDPRVKLGGTVLFIISLFFFKNYAGYVIAALFLGLVIRLSKVPFKFMVKGMKTIVMLMLITVVFNLFLTPGTPLFTIWKLTITQEGLKMAISMAIRLTLLIIGSSVMTLTTTPNNLTDGLEKALTPLKKIKDTDNVTLYDYNLALDLYYYTSTWKEQKKILKKSDLELFMRDRGSKIDLLNIQWIYRAKKYYNMKPADIYLMLIPIHYKLSTELVKDMVEAPGVEEFENVVIRTTYARHYNFKQNLTMEQMYADCLHHLYTADRRKNPYSVSAINTYLFLKEEELKKLTTVMECVRYGLNPGETAAYIGGRTR